MRHAGEQALAALEPMLGQLRSLPGLTEKRPGVFYRGSGAFLHFHEDPAGLFADLKRNGEWIRLALKTRAQQTALIRHAREALGLGAPPSRTRP